MIERGNRGKIMFNKRDLSQIRSSQIPFIRREMGLIFQDYKLLNDRTVFDNVALPLVIMGYSAKEINGLVRAALSKVGLLGKERKLPLTLSGGEQQRVGIARAVVHKPLIILADEPTGNLDPELSAEIMHLFEQFQNVGVTVLIATHDISLISTLNHRVLRLDHGNLVASVK